MIIYHYTKKWIERLIFITLYTLIISGCILPFNPDGDDSDYVIVIEGDIVINGISRIYLSYTMPLSNSNDNLTHHGFISNAQVKIIAEDLTEVPGIAASDDFGTLCYELQTTNLDENMRYKLQVKIGSENYESEWCEVLVSPEIEEIGYEVNQDERSLQIFVNSGDPSGKERYYKWSYVENWQYRSQYFTYYYYDRNIFSIMTIPNGITYYNCWDRYRSTELILFSTEALSESIISEQPIKRIYNSDNRLNYLYSIDVYQTVLSKRAYNYWQNIKKNSDEIGGLFSPKPSEIRGNITCISDPEIEVMGYISAVKQSFKRTFIDVKSLNLYKTPRCPDLPKEPEGQGPWTQKQMSDLGFWPVKDYIDDGYEFEWVKNTCVDCRLAGGTKNKPLFWPEDTGD